MKKMLISFLVAGALVACGGSDNGDTKQAKDLTKDPVYQNGLKLATANKCFTCHNIDAPLTGPSYREVAKKYAGASDEVVEQLAQKIIKGGNGVWGEIFMIPHPSLTDDDAKALVRYVLLLK